jgi:hypothetical protein
LRALIDRSGLRLGVNWYLVPDEGHNADGKYVAYLSDLLIVDTNTLPPATPT